MSADSITRRSVLATLGTGLAAAAGAVDYVVDAAPKPDAQPVQRLGSGRA